MGMVSLKIGLSVFAAAAFAGFLMALAITVFAGGDASGHGRCGTESGSSKRARQNLYGQKKSRIWPGLSGLSVAIISWDI